MVAGLEMKWLKVSKLAPHGANHHGKESDGQILRFLSVSGWLAFFRFGLGYAMPKGAGRPIDQKSSRSSKAHLKFPILRPVGRLFVIPLIAVLCLALPAQSEEIVFWHTMNDQESKTLNLIISDFEKKHPHIKIKAQNVPFSDAQNKYKIAAQGGQAPDVLRSEIAWIAEFAMLRFLEEIPLSPEDERDFLEVSKRYGVWEGKNYAVPQVTDCLALLYNKRLLAEQGLKPPETMDELVAVGKKLTNAKEKKWAFTFNPAGYWAQIFVWAFGGGLIDGQTSQIHISDPGSIAGIQFMVDLMQLHQITPKEMDFVNGYENMMTGFKQGRYAMIINGPWATSDILTGAEFKNSDNLGVGIIPRGPAGYFSPVGGHSYVVSRGSKVKQAALSFVNALSSAPNQILLARHHNLLPTRTSAWDSPEIKSLKLVAEFRKQLEKATSRPVIPEGGAIYTSFDKGVEDALSLNKDAARSMRKVSKQWQKLLKHRKKLN